MTLQEYKAQCKEIEEAMKSFDGTPEETIEFCNKLAEKYPQVIQFNVDASNCRNFDEFKNLADKTGLVFESDESAKKIFKYIIDQKLVFEKIKDGQELSDDLLETVIGGKSLWARIGQAFLGGFEVGFGAATVVFAPSLAKIFGVGIAAAGVANVIDAVTDD